MFVTFEGPEGAGKSTAIRAVADALKAQGFSVTVTREPGSGSVGSDIRSILLHGEALDGKTELFLFLADRSQHVASLIRPALERGEVVLCDRFADSTVVYQGYGRGLELEDLRRWNEFATGGLRPELTLLFDLDVEVGLGRLQQKDRLDAEPVEFHQRIRNGFLSEARLDPERWVILDADAEPERVSASALQRILERLSSREELRKPVSHTSEQ